MKISDVLQRDPRTHPLVNNGQASVAGTKEMLHGELSTFVCEGQYADAIQRILRSFIDNLGRTNQQGAWVSGFFGSGKSHLLKMLCHLWMDTELPDGATARAVVPAMPDDLHALLRELDTHARRSGGKLAAAGSLLSGGDNVRLTILAVLLAAAGLPAQYPQARFCLWLHAQGWLGDVRGLVERDGKIFDRELNNLYVSGAIARAVMTVDPNFASSEADARQAFRAQFPPQEADITTEQFVRIAKDVLRYKGRDGSFPCTLLILDEVQQYIGDSQPRAVIVTEVVEAVSRQLDSHVMVVASGQSALTDTAQLQYLHGRFTIRAPLSDAEVETVTRKVLLQKQPSAAKAIRAVLDKHAGEVSRQLQGTQIGERAEDREIIVEDYPLLPVRRRFWEHCYRQIDPTGTESQLRSQLGVIHKTVSDIADRPLGALIPADTLYDWIARGLAKNAVLQRELEERIIEVGKTDGSLARRICGLVFLIGRLPRAQGADIGVRASKEHIADLLIDDLAGDNGKLRAEVDATLKTLADKGVLVQIGDEFSLQTREGSEWDREFRGRQAKIRNDDAEVHFKRDQYLYAEMDKRIRAIRLQQGAAKEGRQLRVHRGQTPPEADRTGVAIWIRDQWTCEQKDVEEAARAAGNDDPTLFVLIPQKSADELRRAIVNAEAAEQTLNARGNPTTPEGQAARQGMQTRRDGAAAERDQLVREVVDNAKVYQGGGAEALQASLDERIRAAAKDSLVRLFPRFGDGDSAAWSAVIKRARDGADNPFQPTGHSDATERHPVCREVLSAIGTGKTGGEVRKVLTSAPFGWPKDAIDAALMALQRSQHIRAQLNGAVIPVGQVNDQNKIAKTEFRTEQATLTTSDRIALRALFQGSSVACRSGEEGLRARDFLAKLMALAESAGGPPPLPAAPSTADIEDVQRLDGNEQLVAILNKADEWKAKIRAWTEWGELIARRKPAWELAERLARHADGIADAKTPLEQIEAIRAERLLVQAADPVDAVRQTLAKLLREAVQAAHAAHVQVFDAAIKTLAENEVWSKLPAAEQERIKGDLDLRAPGKPEIASDEALADHLERRSLSNVQLEMDAAAGRIATAIERAAKFLEPTVQKVRLERSTLRDANDVDVWIGRLKTKLLEAIRNGPVLVD